MISIKVIVRGALGKMGQEVVKAVCHEPGLELIGAVDLQAKGEIMALPDSSGEVPISSSLEKIIDDCKPDVMVDFTVAGAAMSAARVALKRGVHPVIGTTGLSEDDLGELKKLAGENNVGVMVASNFALGAVLMMYAEIIELHHDQKADAPSGTAVSTARAMAEARGGSFLQPTAGKNTEASRGEQSEGIRIHSVRLPGLMAHQEVLLGTSGQTLSIRHDTVSRECYMPGVILAVKEVVKRKGLIYGLDNLLNL